jgi:hypothetical protein
MKLSHVLGGATLALASLLVGCGSSSDSGGDLSPGTGSGGGGSTGGQYTVVLDGPDCTEPGSSTSGYTATVKTRSGAVASGVYVALSARTNPTDATTSVGTIRAAKPDGSGTTLNGGTTNTAGVVAFSFTPPSSAIRESVAISLVAKTSTDATTSCAATGTACYGVELQPTVKPSVSVQGPLVGGARVPSRSLTVESGELAPDFLVTVTRSSSCSSGGRTSGATIAVTPALTGGSVRIVQGTTALDGTASFDYQAPTVSASSAEKLSVVATYNGVASDATVYELTVAPPPPPGSTVVTITGPTTASAGAAQSGYTALVETVETTTSSTGASTTTRSARPNTQLNLSVTNGTVTTQANANGIGGVTDEFGKVAFSITPSTSSTSNQTLTITGATVNTNDTVLTSSCALSASRCSTTFQVRVQPDSFQFTAPVFGASGTVGELNAVPLSFQWATAGTSSATATPAKAGVAGCVNLSATFTGNGTSPYLLKINGDNVPASQTRVVKLDANGNFQVPVAVLSDRSGFVQVTAAENRSCVTSTTSTSGTLSATTGVQFVDEICETTADGRNCVDLTAPLRVLTSPDTAGAQRTADLSFQVLNSAYAPVDGAQVLFRIVTKGNASDPNERVFPGGGTTNASGVATSKYYIPTFNPALSTTDTSKFVDVQACVRRQTGSSESAEVCSTRRIQIVAPSS